MILFGLLQRLLALFSVVLLVLGGWLIWSWYDLEQSVRAVNPYLDASNVRLYWGLALLAWSALGRFPLLMLLGRRSARANRFERHEGFTVEGADGSALRVESYGPATAPALILTHGWGLNSTIWWEAKAELSRRFRLVVWDLPGLGKSSQPADRRYDMDRLAEDLGRVIAAVSPERPVLLVGHSIGGMIVQTYLRNHREALERQVAGVVLANTTHRDPVETMALHRLFRPIQKPLIEPLMKLDVLLSPLVWTMNWLSYFNGHTHIAARIAGFYTQPSRAVLDQTCRVITESSPAVQAKGNLAMMRWHVTEDLPSLRAPALVFLGEKDLITLPRAGDQIAGALPDARGISVEAGHMGPFEQPLDYNRAIEAFADEVLLAGALPAEGEARGASDTVSPSDAGSRPGSPEPGSRGGRPVH